VNKKLLIGLVPLFILLVALITFSSIGKKRVSLRPPKENRGSLSGLVMQAKALEAKEKWLEAKKEYQRLISEFPSSNEVMAWQKRIEDINLKLLFSPLATSGSALYEIKPGDTLTKIAGQFKTTPELIMKSNNMSSDKLFPGKKLKVWTLPFTIVVDKSQNLLMLKINEEVFKTYNVSTGLNDSTPAGNFKIINKLPNPTWFKAGGVVPAGSPENILGTRWLGFDLAGYGIHGTTEPQSLGQQVTQGCVRMLNAEVEELYAIVPLGTEVTVVD
jgi:lipoprotein-anchoring transpeptidase ErfK/SrfK